MKRNEAGFTLIELVLVGALLSVLVGLTVPGFRLAFDRFAEERAASELEEVSHYARSIAIMRGTPVRISFSDEDGGYRLLRGTDGKFIPLAGTAGRRHILPGGAQAQGTARDVTFLPNGTAMGGPLDIWRGKEALWRVHVDPVLGELKCVEPSIASAG